MELEIKCRSILFHYDNENYAQSIISESKIVIEYEAMTNAKRMACLTSMIFKLYI